MWKKVTADRRRTSLFERLRQVLSLLLQVAFVFLVLLAIARPRLGGDAERERRFVLVVDLGASMQARIDLASDRTRLDEAKSLAKAFVLALGEGDSVAIVTSEGATSFESDRTRLVESIDGLRVAGVAGVAHPPSGVNAVAADIAQPPSLSRGLPREAAENEESHPGAGVPHQQESQPGAAGLHEAVRFAMRLAGGRADRVVVFTDQAFVEDAYVAQAPSPVALQPSSQPRAAAPHKPQVTWRQIGKPLDNVAITKFAARTLPESPGEYELLYEVANFGRGESRVRLQITRGGAAIEERALDMAPGARVSDVLRGLAGDDATLSARIVDAEGKPLRDGLASDDVASASVRAPRVVKALVVGAPDFFLDAALKSDPFVVASRVASADYKDPDNADVVIFDGFAPTAAPERAVYINAQGPGSPVKSAGEIADAFVDRVEVTHPVMRYVGRLAELSVARSRTLVLEPGDVALASCAGSPVMLARERGSSRLVAIGFDLRESDLPLRVAFPKIVRNAVRWTATGEAPDVSTVTGGVPGESVSDLWAARSTAAPGCVEETAFTPEGGCATPARSTGLDLWPALAATALALTLVEWVSWHRRWTV
jgi:hypothetical protein